MAKKSNNQVSFGLDSHKSNIYSIGNQGNQVEIDYLGQDNYRVICRDHFSENFVDYYLNKKELKGLADFLNKYLENNQ